MINIEKIYKEQPLAFKEWLEGANLYLGYGNAEEWFEELRHALDTIEITEEERARIMTSDEMHPFHVWAYNPRELYDHFDKVGLCCFVIPQFADGVGPQSFNGYINNGDTYTYTHEGFDSRIAAEDDVFTHAFSIREMQLSLQAQEESKDSSSTAS